MASVTKDKSEKPMATDVIAPGADEGPGRGKPPKAPPTATKPGAGGHGFFTVYKKGQGYWTRLGTAIAAALLILLTTWNVYLFLASVLPFEPDPGLRETVTQLEQQVEAAPAAQKPALQEQLASATRALNAAVIDAQSQARLWAAIIAGVLGLVTTFFLWRLMNKPSNADFLIATDGEMKKVNWTSRKDLIGSTKVVIMFMFMVAIFLALVDVVFSYFFHIVGVLHEPGQTIGGG